ncbi:hypothetical protein COY07_04345 [Candidatus Peregrinibacteria bacterium CG_4_10_14_0_2_um_filter_43_11]|nr:MAG: hypothetical protein COY07_04345 [Candidatus Peregrinibacteria bacterium CG_4_10_14_0_2_um_filter_43_11]
MKKQNKILLSVLAVVVVGVAFYAGNPELFQGRMTFIPKSIINERIIPITPTTQRKMLPAYDETKKTQRTTENELFTQLKTKVDELNKQISNMDPHGSEEKEIKFQLFDIVAQLNKQLVLGLENTSLDIHSEGINLVITFSTDIKEYTDEYSNTYYNSDDESKGKYVKIHFNATSTKIIIEPDLSVEWHVKDNITGKTTVTN